VHKLFRIRILLLISSRSSGFGNFHWYNCFWTMMQNEYLARRILDLKWEKELKLTLCS